MRKFRGTIVDDSDLLFEFIDRSIRRVLPSVKTIRIRSRNNDVLLSFGDLSDFVEASAGATSANIKCELINTFEIPNEPAFALRTIESCLLRLECVEGCMDIRLCDFIGALVASRIARGLTCGTELEDIRSDLIEIEALGGFKAEGQHPV